MSASSRRRFLLGLMMPLTLQACQPQLGSEKIARQFIEDYYVHLNPRGAQNYATGLANEKISHQINLLAGQPPEAQSQLPQVSYQLISTAESSEKTEAEAGYIFEVSSQAGDIGKLKVFLKLRNIEGKWKVTQFTEQR